MCVLVVEQVPPCYGITLQYMPSITSFFIILLNSAFPFSLRWVSFFRCCFTSRNFSRLSKTPVETFAFCRCNGFTVFLLRDRSIKFGEIEGPIAGMVLAHYVHIGME